MARDFKNTRRPKDKAAPGWLWMVAGLAVGLFVALLVYLDDHSKGETAKPAPMLEEEQAAEPAPKFKEKSGPAAKEKTESASKAKAVSNANANAKDKAEAQAQKPRFDFYNLLPEMEVQIPEQELAAEREKKAIDNTVYYLQAGSFRRFEDADRMRAQLALLNIETQIQRVTVNDAQTWHRVRAGPYTSAREMDKVRTRLRGESIDPIVLKTR